MAILVTGGAGFIGSHVVKDLLESGEDVVVLDDFSGGHRDNIPNGAKVVQGSILDTGLLAKIFVEHRFKWVYHLAAYAAEGLSHFIRRFNYTNNVVGSINLINESIRTDVECFVFTSSIAVYGANQLPMREDLVPAPEDPYGIAKLAVEQDLAAAARLFDLNYVIFRPHNVYGENQNVADPYRNVVGIFMNRLLQGRAMPIFGDGSQTRAFSYIRDVSPVIASAPRIPKANRQVFNIGADQESSVLQLAHLVAEVLERPVAIEWLARRHEVAHAYSDHRKATDVFGPRPATELRTGLARMADWVRSVPARAETPFQDIEIDKGLPPSWSRPL